MVAADALHSAPPRASAPGPASQPVGMEHEVGGRGAAEVGGGRAGGSPRASQAAAAHLVRAGSSRAGLGLGGATPAPSWVNYPAHPTHPLT